MRRDSPLLRDLRLCVNWGTTTPPLFPDVRTLNSPAAVAAAADKVEAFRKMHDYGVMVPPFWTNAADVQRTGTDIVLARTMTRASGGRGIVVVRHTDQLPRAPLYVKYIRKESEYRVHVLGGVAAVVQQKRRRNGEEQTADQQLIRNYDNGWIFAVENVAFVSPAVEETVKEQAVAAVMALGLDFGAVDIIVNRRGSQVYVLEVNTAPGIESPTVLAAYLEYINREHGR